MLRKRTVIFAIVIIIIAGILFICRSITFTVPIKLINISADRISDSTVEVKFQAITSLDKYAKYEVEKRDDGVYLKLRYYKFPFLRGNSSGGGTAEIECPQGCKVFLVGSDGSGKEIFSD